MSEPMNYCIDCQHQIVERHEDYMGQEMWYLGDCEYKRTRIAEVPCPDYLKGAPIRKDCRSKADMEFDI